MTEFENFQKDIRWYIIHNLVKQFMHSIRKEQALFVAGLGLMAELVGGCAPQVPASIPHVEAVQSTATSQFGLKSLTAEPKSKTEDDGLYSYHANMHFFVSNIGPMHGGVTCILDLNAHKGNCRYQAIKGGWTKGGISRSFTEYCRCAL